MPDPLPNKLGGMPGDISSDRAENNLWELGANEPAVDKPGAPMDGRLLPQRENRRRPEVHIGIQARSHTVEDETRRLPDRRVESEFETLDALDDPNATGILPAPDSASGQAHPRVDEFVDTTGVASGAPKFVSKGVPDEMAEAASIPTEEDKSAKTPVGMVEWIALGILGLLLIGLSVGAYFWSIRLIPEEIPRWKSVEFPVKGARVEIKHAVTYWREPVLEGPDKDPVRRGVRLIPVIDMDLSGGPVSLRVIFRNEEGKSMGDPIFRAVSSSGKLELTSTAGFEDPGMHAAYRTGDLEPWSVEISEAGSTDAPGSAYTLILKMNISSELR